MLEETPLLHRHTLMGTLRNLRGNARACVITEPLWGIPYSLFTPYVSIYMLALGLSDSQVGMVTSISLAGQILFAIFSGIITDKLGRRRATLIFDILGWSVACLIWSAAGGLAWFIAGGLVQSFRKVPDISWNCLLVEDTDPDDLVHIYSWVYIAGQVSAFLGPVAGLLISHFSLVPTMRGLYMLSFVMMTIKFVWLNAMVTETAQGKVRMAETRGQSIFSLLRGYPAVVRQVLGAPHTLYTIALMAIVSITVMIQSTFWSIIVTQRIGIPDGPVALFPFVRSIILLLCLFFVVPRMRGVNFGRPMLVAFGAFMASQVLLVLCPPHNYVVVVLATLLEGYGYAIIATQTERLTAINVDPQERARIVSVAHVVVLACTTPFGWIAGALSGMNRINPFLLNIALIAVGMVVVRALRATGADSGETA